MKSLLCLCLLEAKSRGMQKSRKRKQQKDKNTEVNGQVEIKMVGNNMVVCALKVKSHFIRVLIIY